jgi:hypothetical protein
MVTSNWPVCTVAGSYTDPVGATLGVLDELSADERAAVLGGTCERWYGDPVVEPRWAPPSEVLADSDQNSGHVRSELATWAVRSG